MKTGMLWAGGVIIIVVLPFLSVELSTFASLYKIIDWAMKL